MLGEEEPYYGDEYAFEVDKDIIKATSFYVLLTIIFSSFTFLIQKKGTKKKKQNGQKKELRRPPYENTKPNNGWDPTLLSQCRERETVNSSVEGLVASQKFNAFIRKRRKSPQIEVEQTNSRLELYRALRRVDPDGFKRLWNRTDVMEHNVCAMPRWILLLDFIVSGGSMALFFMLVLCFATHRLSSPSPSATTPAAAEDGSSNAFGAEVDMDAVKAVASVAAATGSQFLSRLSGAISLPPTPLVRDRIAHSINSVVYALESNFASGSRGGAAPVNGVGERVVDYVMRPIDLVLTSPVVGGFVHNLFPYVSNVSSQGSAAGIRWSRAAGAAATAAVYQSPRAQRGLSYINALCHGVCVYRPVFFPVFGQLAQRLPLKIGPVTILAVSATLVAKMAAAAAFVSFVVLNVAILRFSEAPSALTYLVTLRGSIHLPCLSPVSEEQFIRAASLAKLASSSKRTVSHGASSTSASSTVGAQHPNSSGVASSFPKEKTIFSFLSVRGLLSRLPFLRTRMRASPSAPAGFANENNGGGDKDVPFLYRRADVGNRGNTAGLMDSPYAPYPTEEYGAYDSVNCSPYKLDNGYPSFRPLTPSNEKRAFFLSSYSLYPTATTTHSGAPTAVGPARRLACLLLEGVLVVATGGLTAFLSLLSILFTRRRQTFAQRLLGVRPLCERMRPANLERWTYTAEVIDAASPYVSNSTPGMTRYRSPYGNATSYPAFYGRGGVSPGVTFGMRSPGMRSPGMASPGMPARQTGMRSPGMATSGMMSPRMLFETAPVGAPMAGPPTAHVPPSPVSLTANASLQPPHVVPPWGAVMGQNAHVANASLAQPTTPSPMAPAHAPKSPLRPGAADPPRVPSLWGLSLPPQVVSPPLMRLSEAGGGDEALEDEAGDPEFRFGPIHGEWDGAEEEAPNAEGDEEAGAYNNYESVVVISDSEGEACEARHSQEEGRQDYSSSGGKGPGADLYGRGSSGEESLTRYGSSAGRYGIPNDEDLEY